MGTSEEPGHLAGATLGEHRYIRAFFKSAAEEHRVLLPFIKKGLIRGEKAYHVVDPDLAVEHHRQLCAAGIDVAAIQMRGRLELHHYPRTRTTGHVEWAGADWPWMDEFLEYEGRLNQVVPRSRHCVICVYDLSKTRADLIMDVMRTHPMVILGGVLQVNPFFVPPDQYQHELREGRIERPARSSDPG
jgi:hypothetical protein